jgi:hypothetical protein
MSLGTNRWAGRFGVQGLLYAVALIFACPAWAQRFSGPPPQGAAVIIQMDGRVDVMLDSTPWALSKGNWVEPGRLILTGPDGDAIFQLADGSTFEVFANSRVEFRSSQGSWRDLLEVWLGNIKVHIQKLGGQPNFNRVHTPTALISVRGTTFLVKVEDDGNTTEVMVQEGLVDVENATTPGGKPVSLATGDTVRVYKNVPLARNMVDKGALGRQVARGAAQAAYQVLLGRRSTPGAAGTSTPSAGAGSAGAGGVGDTKAPAPPPPPPPPPPSAGGAPPPPPPSGP